MATHRYEAPEPGERKQRRRPVPAEDTLPADLLNAPRLARRLGCSKQKIYTMATAGQIPGAIRFGDRWLFSAKKIDQWLHGDTEAEQ